MTRQAGVCQHRGMKRLVVCCDGTWNKPDSPSITNIEKIARTVQTDPAVTGGVHQLVYYASGVGAGSYAADRLLGGAFGFGLFQTPNNRTMVGAAPPERAGGASGMLSTARLVGQTTGAALVGLVLGWMPGMPVEGPKAALEIGCALAALGACVSLLRLRA